MPETKKSPPQESKNTPWDCASIRNLIDTLIEKDVAEFELEEDGRRIHIKRGGGGGGVPSPFPAGAAPAAVPAAAPPASNEEEGLVTITSPIVGTYYESPSPGAPEFISVGDRVEAGQVLCIIEAMKLMNEIEAEMAGQIVRKLATNGQPVEFGQALLVIRPA